MQKPVSLLQGRHKPLKSSCSHCTALIEGRAQHPHLQLLSALPSSRLYKCSSCNAFLHWDRQGWEIFVEGRYSLTTQPPLPQYDYQSLEKAFKAS